MNLEEAREIPVEWLAKAAKAYMERHKNSSGEPMTREEFAERAQIAPATLDKVLSERTDISDHTRERVATVLEMDGDFYDLGQSIRARQIDGQISATIDSDREIPAKKRKEVKIAVLAILREARKE